MSDLATRTSTVCNCAASSAGRGLLPVALARYAATPPALSAMVRTTIRAVYIRFTIYVYAAMLEVHALTTSPPNTTKQQRYKPTCGSADFAERGQRFILMVNGVLLFESRAVNLRTRRQLIDSVPIHAQWLGLRKDWSLWRGGMRRRRGQGHKIAFRALLRGQFVGGIEHGISHR